MTLPERIEAIRGRIAAFYGNPHMGIGLDFDSTGVFLYTGEDKELNGTFPSAEAALRWLEDTMEPFLRVRGL